MAATKQSTINVKINMENDEIEVIENMPETKIQEEYLIEEELDEMEAVELVPTGEGSMAIKVKEIIEHECGKCGKQFKAFAQLKKHMAICRNKPKLHKDLPEKNSQLYHHLFKDIVMTEKSCQDMEDSEICFCCEESFEDAHHGHIRCPHCPKSFKNSHSFERHLIFIHADTDQFPCDICNAKCASKFFLELHINSHRRGKPFGCQICGKEFTRRYHLVRHQQYTSCDSRIRKEELPCEVCGKIFYRLDNLRHHLRGHLGEEKKRRDYHCEYCDMSFYGSATLNIHLRTHTGERPFPCDLCDKAFPSNPALRKHRRTHTGEKPYKCSACDRSFAAKEVLNRHMKIHTGERPHVCEVCGKSFIQATQLKSHMFSHTGENGFQCNICSMQFNRKTKLTRHISQEHPSTDRIKHNCEVCNISFKSKKLLEKHSEAHGHENPDVTHMAISILPCTSESKAKIRNAIYYRTETEMTAADEHGYADTIAEKTVKAEPIQEEMEERFMEEIEEPFKEEIEEEEEDEETPLFMDDEQLKESVEKLLQFLLEESRLEASGWLVAPIESVLAEVIRQCGHTPVSHEDCPDRTTVIRENVKLLLTVAMEDETIKSLLNNHTIDEVIQIVVKMASAK